MDKHERHERNQPQQHGSLVRAVALPIAALAVLGIGALFAMRMLAGADSSPAPAATSVALPGPARVTIFAAPRARGRPIVVLDAGHGGTDPGARGVSGQSAEKDLTLMLASELKDELVRRGRVRVAMTRSDDHYVGLEERAAIARSLDAALFVSLHGDSAANAAASGASVYSLSDVASDAEAAKLAASQNSGMPVTTTGDGSVRSLLADLAMRSQMNASAELALRIVRAAQGKVALRPQPHRFAAFHVLRRAGMPAVLVEAGYLSNSADEARLRDPVARQALVRALAAGIETDVAARKAR